MSAPVPTALNSAFNNAHYIVFTPTASFTLLIGGHSKPLAELMKKHGASTLAILTAYNPGGVINDLDNNNHAQQLLLNRIQQLGLPYLIGKNCAPDGCSHAEPTLVALGIHRKQAYALAQQFGQLAFVYADAHATPELVWTHTPDDLSAPMPGQ